YKKRRADEIALGLGGWEMGIRDGARGRGSGGGGAQSGGGLAAAGGGRVDVLDGGGGEPGAVAPGGLGPQSVGRLRAEAAEALVRAASPGPGPRARPGDGARGRTGDGARGRTGDGARDRPGDGTRGRTREGTGAGTGTGTGAGARGAEPGLALVVVAPRDGLHAWAPDPEAAADWVAGGAPHLYAGVLEGTGVVGPLVLPGATGCAGCLERERVARDRSWARMLVQWRSAHRRRGSPACDLGLATAVAGLAAAHALAFLDGELPASTGARWEAALPGLHWQRVVVSAHPECGCGAASSGR
ncbi:TOMM precursor leader peptide-binding protein, partial [Streptomyces bambusae]|nr:TOMM precursor leader peptide-binding protein [Streptomyces bambusae]